MFCYTIDCQLLVTWGTFKQLTGLQTLTAAVFQMNMSMEVVRMMDSISTMEEYSKMFDLDMPDPDENTKDRKI